MARSLSPAGNDGQGEMRSSELYDPASGLWSSTGDLVHARISHTATLLPNGMVLVSRRAGYRLSGDRGTIQSQRGTWTSTDNLYFARANHTATLLPTGKVLVAGGYGNEGYLNTAELYDPATGTWAITGSLSTARFGHTATLLPNGEVLVAGGADSEFFDQVELYDPASGTWSDTDDLETGRT